MKACPECGTEMVRWGHGRMERWRCPACHRVRRKDYHQKVGITDGAPQTQALIDPTAGRVVADMCQRILIRANDFA